MRVAILLIMRIFTIVLSIIAFGFSAPGHAADFAGSGDLLRMIQKIQGVWQRHCTPVSAERFESIKLRFTYTHLIVESEVYSDNRCVKADSRVESIYRYWIGDKLNLPDGKAVFSLDLSPKTVPDRARPWHPANIIFYRDGALLFGKSPGNSRERARALDETRAFTRR